MKARASKLGRYQRAFPPLVAKLIFEAYTRGYEISFGEAYRPLETALLYQKHGKGIKNSLHTLRLAIDLNLFKDGKYLTRTEEYEELGKWWEEQSTEELKCSWGGRFNDGNHFSLEFNGVR